MVLQPCLGVGVDDRRPRGAARLVYVEVVTQDAGVTLTFDPLSDRIDRRGVVVGGADKAIFVDVDDAFSEIHVSSPFSDERNASPGGCPRRRLPLATSGVLLKARSENRVGRHDVSPRPTMPA